MDKIDIFDGEYSFLSNFYPSTITMHDGITYSTVEHAFQAHKSDGTNARHRIANLRTPGAAKREGRKVKLRHDWEQVKLAVMEEAVRRKFENPDLAERLIATGEAELIEGNYWNDTFWGVCNGKGKNHLGQILMKIRKQIQS